MQQHITTPPTTAGPPPLSGSPVVRWIEALRGVFRLAEDVNLLKAQYRAFSHQVPLMYAILIVNSWALASTHLSLAPPLLTVLVPALLTAVSIGRIIYWWRQRLVDPGIARARAALGRTMLLAVVLSLAFSSWALSLYAYGTPFARAHVAFFMAITLVSCVFCLMYLRPAALVVAAIVNAVFIAFFVATGEPTLIASALNLALVSLAMLIVVTVNYAHFRHMVEVQVRAVALGNENLRLANLDSLTELPNRRAFFAELERTFATARRDGSGFAVGIVDLDGFKPVNDTYGHVFGDKLLREVSRRMTSTCCECGAMVARLGGDEFALLFRTGRNADLLASCGARLCEVLAEPFSIGDITVQISGSIGFAAGGPDIASPAELMSRADYALYQSKRSHRGTATLFTPAHSAMITRATLVEQALRQANPERELRVVFQPIIDLAAGRPVGFEALARWCSPTLGDVAPGEFIPIAERSGLVGRLTTHLLREALAVARTWPAELHLSFNLSANDLASAENADRIATILRGSGIAMDRVYLEVTETAFSVDPTQVQRSVADLKDLGCRIAIDDFGTGYSSLSRLHALPLTQLKIDRSFVAGIETGTASFDIVRSLVGLARDRRLDCIAEGVETARELAVLRELGVTLVQGFLFARPLEASDIPAWLAEASAADRAWWRAPA